MKDLVKKSYNKVARRYSEARDQFKNQKYLQLLTDQLPGGSLILDIGCGSGVPIDAFLIEHGYQVLGIDISEAQIALAKERVPQAQYEVRDMDLLKTGEYSVDAVVSFYAIFHIPRERHLELLRKIHSFIKPGGLLLVTMGASDWVGTEDFYGEPMSWSHFDAEKNQTLVKQAGFKLIQAEVETTGNEQHLSVLAKAI